MILRHASLYGRGTAASTSLEPSETARGSRCLYDLGGSRHLILQLGYFKAKRQFLGYAREAVTEDLEPHPRCHFLRGDGPTSKGLSKATSLEAAQAS